MIVSPSRRSCAINTRAGARGAVRLRPIAPAAILPAASGSTTHREGPRLLILTDPGELGELRERFVQDDELQDLLRKPFFAACPRGDVSIDGGSG